MLKLSTGQRYRQSIKKIRKDPEFYHVGGNCCWKVYSKASHRGESTYLKQGVDRRKNEFPIKSVKLTHCT